MSLSSKLTAAAVIFAMFMFGTVWGWAQEAARPPQSLHLTRQLMDAEHQMVQFDRRFKDIKQQIETNAAELAQFQHRRNEVIEQQNALKVSSASFDAIMAFLQTQRIQLIIELAGLDARREAIMQSQKPDQPADDAALPELLQKLRELVVIQREAVAHSQGLRELGVESANELNKERQKLIDAEIRLLEAERSANRNELGSAAGDVAAISVDRAEKSAKLAKVEQLITHFTPVREIIDDLSIAERVIADLTAQQKSLQSKLSDTEAALENAKMQYSIVRQAMEDAKKDDQD